VTAASHSGSAEPHGGAWARASQADG
jgi:hypothetical protein